MQPKNPDSFLCSLYINVLSLLLYIALSTEVQLDHSHCDNKKFYILETQSSSFYDFGIVF